MIRRVFRLLDGIAYRAFSHQLETRARTTDRSRFRALGTSHPYETFRIRQYAIGWVLALAVAWMAGLVGYDLLVGATSGGELDSILRSAPAWQLATIAAGFGTVLGLMTRLTFDRLVSLALRSLARRRRTRIQRTLPGAVRFLRVVATAAPDLRTLVEAVASREQIHGATARRFDAIRRRAALTGRYQAAVKAAARDTPANSTLAPFLVTFVKRARQGDEPLRSFLAAESRLLATEDERRSRREGRLRGRVIGTFVVLLAAPLLVTIGFLWAGVLVPGIEGPTADLLGPVQANLLTLVGTGAIVVIGGTAALFAIVLRPQADRWAVPEPAQSVRQTVRRCLANPTNTLLVTGPIAMAVLGLGVLLGWNLGLTLLVGYLVVALPTGLVDLRRARRRSRMDAALPSFVHQLSDRLDGGSPLRAAVADIAMEEQNGPLQGPVEKLAADLRLLQGPAGGRKRALERFVGRIGTPVAGRTIGLAIGAIEAGADAKAAVSHLRTETGRLEHGADARRGGFPAVLLIGGAVATFVVAIIAVVNGMILETATPTGPVAGVTMELGAADPTPRPELFVLTQVTMLASGLFAGLTGRGVYEGLLHSGVLLVIAAVGFRLAGLL